MGGWTPQNINISNTTMYQDSITQIYIYIYKNTTLYQDSITEIYIYWIQLCTCILHWFITQLWLSVPKSQLVSPVSDPDGCVFQRVSSFLPYQILMIVCSKESARFSCISSRSTTTSRWGTWSFMCCRRAAWPSGTTTASQTPSSRSTSSRGEGEWWPKERYREGGREGGREGVRERTECK